jgi:hypothetical protein
VLLACELRGGKTPNSPNGTPLLFDFVGSHPSPNLQSAEPRLGLEAKSKSRKQDQKATAHHDTNCSAARSVDIYYLQDTGHGLVISSTYVHCKHARASSRALVGAPPIAWRLTYPPVEHPGDQPSGPVTKLDPLDHPQPASGPHWTQEANISGLLPG